MRYFSIKSEASIIDVNVGGPNDLCITDYRKRYEKLVKENPKYKWKLHNFNGLDNS